MQIAITQKWKQDWKIKEKEKSNMRRMSKNYWQTLKT